MTGLYTFEFIRDEGPIPGDALILRESMWREASGIFARVYGFSNGEATEVRLPTNADDPEQNFQKWEQRQLASGSEGVKEAR